MLQNGPTTGTMNCFGGPFFGIGFKNKLQKSQMSFNFDDSKILVFVPFFLFVGLFRKQKPNMDCQLGSLTQIRLNVNL